MYYVLDSEDSNVKSKVYVLLANAAWNRQEKEETVVNPQSPLLRFPWDDESYNHFKCLPARLERSWTEIILISHKENVIEVIWDSFFLMKVLIAGENKNWR